MTVSKNNRKLNEVTLEIIQKCPNYCMFCSSNSSIEKTNSLSYDLLMPVISDLKTLGVKQINISGGEPLIHEEIISILKEINKHNIDINLYTSGVVLDANGNHASISESLISELSNLKINKVVFDLQTINNERYNQLMGTKDNLSKALKSMRLISKHFNTEAHFIPNKVNQEDLEDLLQFAVLRLVY